MTYADLLADISSFSSSPFFKEISASCVALKIKSPYLCFVAILSCMNTDKLAVLISHLETDTGIKKLNEQVHFDLIIEDHHVEKNSGSTHLNFKFKSIDFDKPLLVLFSSGSTSAPKGVVLSFNNLYYSAIGFSEFFNQGPKDCSLINLPHHHVGGLMILWRSFFQGGSVTTDINKTPDFISLVPLQLKRMMEDQNKIQTLRKIRVILIGGAPLTSVLKSKALELGLKLFQTYGMTETASALMINGHVLPYREVMIDDDGFFRVQGKTLALGHYQNNEFILFQKKWFKTNDRGVKDSQGIFHFIERSDLIFISGGENINPLHIEETVKENPLIKDAYLIGIADEQWGEIGILLYETHSGAELRAGDLLSELKIKLHPHLVPKFCFKTAFELNGQIKVKRFELKNLAKKLYLKHIFSFNFIENKDKPTIVFFHGFMGNQDDLAEISTHLKSRYSLLYLDLPGHGETQIKHFHSFNDLFIKLTSFIKLFSNDPIFYGYSMGGRIALHLALNFFPPKKLILESAGLGLESTFEQQNRQKNDFNLFSNTHQHNLPEFLNRWYENPMFFKFTQHKNYQNEIRNRSQHDLTQWRDSQKYLSSGFFPLLRENLELMKKTKFPLFYIFGEEDHKYKNYAKNLAKMNLETIKTICISSSGHNPHKTHPTEIAKILTETLK